MSQALLRSDLKADTMSQCSNAENFQRIAALVNAETGIKLPPTKRLMVEGRLRKRARALKLSNLEQYYSLLFDEDKLASELVHIIDVVTTNKTDFFREPDHFTCLRNRLVPALLNMRSAGTKPRLKLWSAASSNGAEAYTIAMVMADLAKQISDLRFAVLGTDISTEVLAAGERAVYSEEAILPVPEDMKARYLMRGKGTAFANQVRIVPELRRAVRFQRLNLMDESYPIDHDVDVIFLRNVLIYFEKSTQEAVVRRLMRHLRYGGFIILGHSESMIGTNLRLKQWTPGVFQNV